MDGHPRTWMSSAESCNSADTERARDLPQRQRQKLARRDDGETERLHGSSTHELICRLELSALHLQVHWKIAFHLRYFSRFWVRLQARFGSFSWPPVLQVEEVREEEAEK